MSKTSYYVALLILTLVAFATGSRGAVWPIVMLWILQFLFSEITVRKILISIPLICFVVFLSQFDISTIMFSTVGSMGEAFSRLLRSQSTQRTDTILSIVQLFSNANISDIIFGRGIGGFFPYQNWILSGGNPDRNVYTLYGLRFLVQPHNSFLYMLVECGVVSLIVFIHVFIASILKFVKSGNKNYIFKVLFVLVIMVTNFLDSIFFVQPGVALVFWLLLLMLYEQNVAEAKDKKV